MSEVYSAEDLLLDQTVALKFLAGHLESQSQALEQLRDEARLARQISHPNVCRIFDFGDEDGLVFVTMEFVDGENVANILRRIGKLSPRKAIEIGSQICGGLGAIHDQGIVHRDLKPANVMLDADGKARILDFGLAVPADGESDAHVRGGTPAYMSPEQAQGRDVTVRSDLYSLGLVLWELFTGHRLELRERKATPAVSAQVEGVDPTIDRVIQRCLAEDPMCRPSSAESVAAALRRGQGPETGYRTCTVVACGPTLRAPIRSLAIRDLLECHGGREIWDAVGPCWFFARPGDAASFAVGFRGDQRGESRLGIELTEIYLRERQANDPGQGAVVAEGDAAPLARSLARLALPGQNLLAGYTCHLARKRDLSGGVDTKVLWLSHGRYLLPGAEEPTEVFEVGIEDWSPLRAPTSVETMPAVLDGEVLTGWRPTTGVPVPRRPNFYIERRLGTGGFGEVWLARHQKTEERRVFKFCFETSRLRGLRREITLFRLLKEELGDRPDIARVIDWSLEEPPFFIESEYSSGGDLVDWAKSKGGLENVPMTLRLEIVAQVAEALDAAHSVGVLHKDVKPRNILITNDSDGTVKVQLADFGVGLVTDRQRLEAAGITAVGFSTHSGKMPETSSGGTRLYLAPELLEGKSPTLQADVYALGVVLYQLVVGDFDKALGSGWREGIEDWLLSEDIAIAVHGNPSTRLRNAAELATRLRSLPSRRQQLIEEKTKAQWLKQSERRRKVYRLVALTGVMFLVIVSILAGWALYEREKEAKARHTSEQVTKFLVELFEFTDPNGFQSPIKPTGSDLSALELIDLGAEKLKTAFEDEPRTRAQLLSSIGGIYTELGYYGKARMLVEQALALRTSELGNEHIDVAESLIQKGWLVLPAASREAKHLFEKALSILQKNLGDKEDLRVAECFSALAEVAAIEGLYPDARAMFSKALKVRRRVLGTKHPAVAEELQNLAEIIRKQGFLADAEEVLREVLETKRSVLNDRHLSVADSQADLATTLRQQGMYAEAEILYRNALESAKLHLGDKHPTVVSITLSFLHMLAMKGQYVEAEALAREALEMMQDAFGLKHPTVAFCLASLAYVLQLEGEYGEAGERYRESLLLMREFFGDKHPNVATNLKRLAQLNLAVGKVPDAEAQVQEALEIFRQRFPLDHWKIANTESVAAACLIEYGSYEEAERRLLESYTRVRARTSDFSIYTREVLGYLVQLYQAWGRLDKAEHYRTLWANGGGSPRKSEVSGHGNLNESENP